MLTPALTVCNENHEFLTNFKKQFLKLVEIRDFPEFLKFVKFTFSIYD